MRPPEVLKQLKELRQSWRESNFVFTKEQQVRYDELIKLRRKRVKYFHDNDLVYKSGSAKSTAAKTPTKTPNP